MAGGREGYFYALDTRNGAQLWRAGLGGSVETAPITYRIGDNQYVSVAAGRSLFTYCPADLHRAAENARAVRGGEDTARFLMPRVRRM